MGFPFLFCGLIIVLCLLRHIAYIYVRSKNGWEKMKKVCEMKKNFKQTDRKENDWKSFQFDIVKYGLAAAVLMEIVSLPFLGLSLRFVYGLALGTAISVVNFRIQGYSYEKLLSSIHGMVARMSVAALSFLLRMLLYGAAFLVCVKTGGGCIPGILCGFITIPCGIYYSCVFRKKGKGKKSQKSEEGII